MEQRVSYFRGGVSMLSLSKVNSQPICGVVVPYTLLWIRPPSVLSIPLFSGRFSFLILPHHGLSLPNLVFLQHSYLNKNLIIPFRNLGVILIHSFTSPQPPGHIHNPSLSVFPPFISLYLLCHCPRSGLGSMGQQIVVEKWTSAVLEK